MTFFQITAQLEDLQHAPAAGIERVNELYHTTSTMSNGAQTLPNTGPLAITFQIDFGYAETQTVLNQLSFQLAPGQVLGLLGRTGSGKTTLTRLLFRFLNPPQAIYLAGVDMRQVQLAALRQRIGFVTPDVQLFHATVHDNLTF